MRPDLRAVLGFLFLVLVWNVAAGAVSPTETTSQPLTAENRLSILRHLAYEYATMLQPLPASQKVKEALEVDRAGRINEDKLRQTLANRGVAVQPGEIVQVTDVEFQREAILFEINGGGKKKKKWYERIQIQAGGPGGGGQVPTSGPQQTPPPSGGEGPKLGQGSWILLSFAGALPDMTSEDVKKMLGGVMDFNRQSTTVPWIETIPEEFRRAIEEKRVLVGMNKRMVLTALGRPQRKVREVKGGQETEDWIYGNPPFVTFVTFVGDEVVAVKEYR
jgi:hypothetical protein